jgi:hypothetical protein
MLRRWLLPLALLTAACTKEPLLDPKLSGPDPQQQAPGEAVVEEKVPPGAIGRPYLDRVLREGPGWLFDKVPVEEVLAGGKFIGWRIRELPADWSGSELKSGDVVTRVNAMPVETPSDFWSAWTTLSVASELKIDFRRGEENRVLSVAIVGQPDPKLPASLNEKQAPAAERARDKRFDTVVIEGEPRSTDAPVDWTTKN